MLTDPQHIHIPPSLLIAFFLILHYEMLFQNHLSSLIVLSNMLSEIARLITLLISDYIIVYNMHNVQKLNEHIKKIYKKGIVKQTEIPFQLFCPNMYTCQQVFFSLLPVANVGIKTFFRRKSGI